MQESVGQTGEDDVRPRPLSEVPRSLRRALRLLKAVGGLPMRLAPNRRGGISCERSRPAVLWSVLVSLGLFLAPAGSVLAILSGHHVSLYQIR